MDSARITAPTTTGTSQYQSVTASYHQTRTLLETNASITVSASGDTVSISGSLSSLMETTTYEESGIYDASLASFLPDASGSKTALLSEASTGQDTTDLYLNIVRERVEYLMRRLSEMFIENAGTDAATTAADILQVDETSQTTSVLDGGIYSAGQTAGRIVQFALSFYDGGDRAAFVEEVRGAIMEGFSQAEAAFGGQLPQISHDTIAMVNEALDTFAAANDINTVA